MYRGEYIEYKATPSILKEYSIRTFTPASFNEVIPPTAINGIIGASSDSLLGPDEVVLLGSNDEGVRWRLINHKTNLSAQWNQTNRITIALQNTESYSLYRWVFPKLSYQNFLSSDLVDGGILCTEITAKIESGETITIFPEATVPTGSLIFIQVRNYPYSPTTREYNGELVTYLDSSTPAPTESGGSSAWIFILIILLVLIAIAVATFIVLKKRKVF